jgi:hypothetical protein
MRRRLPGRDDDTWGPVAVRLLTITGPASADSADPGGVRHTHTGQSPMQYLPLSLPFFSILVGLFLLVVALIQVGILRYAYMRLGRA